VYYIGERGDSFSGWPYLKYVACSKSTVEESVITKGSPVASVLVKGTEYKVQVMNPGTPIDQE
jgi:hypothetical protein